MSPAGAQRWRGALGCVMVRGIAYAPFGRDREARKRCRQR